MLTLLFDPERGDAYMWKCPMIVCFSVSIEGKESWGVNATTSAERRDPFQTAKTTNKFETNGKWHLHLEAEPPYNQHANSPNSEPELFKHLSASWNLPRVCI